MTAQPDLVARFALSEEQAATLERYVALVLSWRRARLTGVRARDAATDTLVGDALALLQVLFGSGADGGAPVRLLDLGSGGGSPGFPLAIAAPALSVVLLDSVRKKCDFLVHAAGELGLAGRVHVVCARSEAYAAPGGGGREAFDVVTARAVGALAEVVELAAPALAPGGRLLAPKTGTALAAERAAGDAVAEACGLAAGPVSPLASSPLPDSVCATFVKVRPTPGWLPRRPGVAGRRPPPSLRAPEAGAGG